MTQRRRRYLGWWLVLAISWVLYGLSAGCGGATGVSEEPSTERSQAGGEKSPTDAQDSGVPPERVGEAGPEGAADGGDEAVMDDAVAPEVGAEQAPDAPDAPAAMVKTWWECRRDKERLTAQERRDCDALHTTAPQEARFGIRWVFLYAPSDAEAWIKPRLALLNARFAGAKISFRTHSITRLKDTVLASSGDYDNRKKFTLRALRGELVSLLGLPEATTAAQALDAFKQRLLGVGVHANQVQALTLATSLAPNAFLNRVARALEKEVLVFVAQKLTSASGATPGGYASPPGVDHQAIGRGSIYLKENYRPDALAHEAGHYFGLIHTQAAQETLDVAGLLPTFCRALLPQGLASIRSSLQAHLGADYSGALGEPFVPYNADDTALQAFRALRCAIGRLWVSRVNTFEKVDPQDEKTWKNFASFASFAAHVLGGKQAYEKLFSRQVNGKSQFNCGLGQTSKQIECVYGSKRFLGSHPLLLESIAFQSGAVSNLMSYLNNPTVFPTRVLAKVQDEMLRLYSRSAARLTLYNALLKP